MSVVVGYRITTGGEEGVQAKAWILMIIISTTLPFVECTINKIFWCGCGECHCTHLTRYCAFATGVPYLQAATAEPKNQTQQSRSRWWIVYTLFSCFSTYSHFDHVPYYYFFYLYNLRWDCKRMWSLNFNAVHHLLQLLHLPDHTITNKLIWCVTINWFVRTRRSSYTSSLFDPTKSKSGTNISSTLWNGWNLI